MVLRGKRAIAIDRGRIPDSAGQTTVSGKIRFLSNQFVAQGLEIRLAFRKAGGIFARS